MESCRRNHQRTGTAQVRHNNERRVSQTVFRVLYGAGRPLPSEPVTSSFAVVAYLVFP